MTAQKHLKALVRARMARTGESYTAARRHLLSTRPAPALALTREFRANDKHCLVVQFTPDDAHLLSGGFGGQVRIWTPVGELVGELAGHESSVNVIRLSGDGSTAITAASDKTVRLWDIPARKEIADLGPGPRSRSWRSTWMSLVIGPGAADTTAGFRPGACPDASSSTSTISVGRSRRSRCGRATALWPRPPWGAASRCAQPMETS